MLTINARKRGFLRDGKPFFWLGDTAWLLFQKLDDRQIETYLTNRALKGYTVIQATLVHTPGYASPDGERALIDDDFSRPDVGSAYWDHVERAVRRAGELGLVMALLPCWGCFAQDGALTPENAAIYGDFLERRLGRYENVIWLLGGDVRGSAAPQTFEALARALRSEASPLGRSGASPLGRSEASPSGQCEASPSGRCEASPSGRRQCPNQLIGFHPFGRCSSSQWFAGADWLDFHMFQSGHRDRGQRTLGAWDDNAVSDEEWMGEENYLYVFRDLERDDKPTLDGEPSYEEIPHGLHDPSKPYWTDRQVRRYAWWSLLAGAAGFTYGHNAIMQFWDGHGTPDFGARQHWDVALHAPGSLQMIHLRRLMEAIDWQQGRNAQELLMDDSGAEDARNLCFLAPDALAVYTYTSRPFGVRLDALPFRPAAFWYSPKLGGVSAFAAGADGQFCPPADREEAREDWVLLLVDEKSLDSVLSRLMQPLRDHPFSAPAVTPSIR